MNLVSTTTTGAVSLSKRPVDNITTIQVSGDYTGLSFTFLASVDGTNYANVGAIDMSSGLFIPGGTTISPADASVGTWRIETQNYCSVQVNVSAIATNKATFSQNSVEGHPALQVNTNAVGTTLPLAKYSTGTTTTTFTAAEFTGGQLTVYNSTATTPGSIATPTAAAMFAAQPGAAIGQQWIVRVINSSASANTMTITADASVTLSGTTTETIAEFAYRDYLMAFTSATTATMKAIGGGAAATN